LAIQGVVVMGVLCTTAVDWTKLKLTAAVIASAAVPQASAFKPLFIKAFMFASPFVGVKSLCTK
jgi:hypothetical protein